MNPSKDAIVLHYHPGSHDLIKWFKIIDALGLYVKDIDDLVIGIISQLKNEIPPPGKDIQTADKNVLVLYPREEKTHGIEYEWGEVSFKSIKMWLEENSGVWKDSDPLLFTEENIKFDEL